MSGPVILAAAAAFLSLSACGGARESEEEILVLAASSLTAAFGEIEVAFEASNPDVDVLMSFGGSSSLREQILAGAPADVFAAANTAVMDQVVSSDLDTGAPRPFARNRLSLAVPLGNPAQVRALADLALSHLFVALCAEAVPCGSLAGEALDSAGVRPDVDSLEPNVKSLVAKLESGEADAGLVYRTDVLASTGVEEVATELPSGPYADYPVVVLGPQDPQSPSSRFVEFLMSEAAQEILAEHGFLGP